MPAPVLVQDLTLTLDATSIEFQLSNAAVVPSYSDSEVVTFSGRYVSTAETHVLHLEGFQDYGSLTSLCEMLWGADVDVDVLAFLLTIEGATWAGNVSPRKPNAGGAAGAPLDFQIDLPVQGDVTYTAPVVFAADEAELDEDDELVDA